MMESESRARRGARKKLRPLLALGIVLAAPSVGLLGFEGYTRWQSARAVTVMPLWLLLRQAESDTRANNWVHQQEILERARAGAITGKDATRVIDRILEWQNNLRVEFGIPGDIAAILEASGEMSAAQLRRYWNQIRRFELATPESVGTDEALPFEIVSHYRGGESSNPGLGHLSIHDRIGLRNVFNSVDIEIISLHIGGDKIDIPHGQGGMHREWLRAPGKFSRAWSWWSHTEHWRNVRAPQTPTAQLPLRVVVQWQAAWLRNQDPARVHSPGTLQSILFVPGFPWEGTVTLDAFTRVERAAGRPIMIVDDLAERKWIESQMRAAMLGIAPERPDNIATFVRFPRLADGASVPNSSTVLFGDLVIRAGDHEILANFPETTISGLGIVEAVVPRPNADTLRRLSDANPTGWELVFIPRPERARRKAFSTVAFGGEPIVVPLTVATRGSLDGFVILHQPAD
ncbi:MAG: hypothetical protein KF684_10775 [Phycisphaeraceae bacterium]|nr:hypothetical protein [Phycisphaeraceae bacterium]